MISKRIFDLSLAMIGSLFLGGIILVCLICATIDTKSWGLFRQQRIGMYGKPFQILKIKTLNDKTKSSSNFGKFLRKSKLDELPQLFNILNGTMSFVGPRPDVSGYADHLEGANRIILNVRPGVTGLASLKYRHEEEQLQFHSNALQYNDSVIWPDKVRINKWYIENQTFFLDLKILFYTFFPYNFNINKISRGL